MYLKPITEYIATETGLTVNTNLFYGFFPQGMARNILASVITARNNNKVNGYLADYIDLDITIYTVAPNYAPAEVGAFAIYTALHSRFAVDLPIITVGQEFEIMTLIATSAPTYEGQDERNNHVFRTSYNIKIENK